MRWASCRQHRHGPLLPWPGSFPRRRWIVALHHHLVEYPRPAAAFSERIGTALINGTWFVRQLQALGGQAVTMHAHRHVDWIGECGGVRIVSAPSPVMEATDEGSALTGRSASRAIPATSTRSGAMRQSRPPRPAASVWMWKQVGSP